jgi:hypothetical protein
MNDIINRSKDDERYRQDHEKEFVGNYVTHIKNIIFGYLNTKYGKEEIKCVYLEIEKINNEIELAEKLANNKSSSKNEKSRIIEMKEKEKDGIRRIFNQFDSDGSKSIDR